MKMHKVISVTPHNDYSITVLFEDGITKVIKIMPFINEGVSKELENLDYFRKVKVIDGYITWNNGYDFCPNLLYHYSPLS